MFTADGPQGGRTWSSCCPGQGQRSRHARAMQHGQQQPGGLQGGLVRAQFTQALPRDTLTAGGEARRKEELVLESGADLGAHSGLASLASLNWAHSLALALPIGWSGWGTDRGDGTWVYKNCTFLSIFSM